MIAALLLAAALGQDPKGEPQYQPPTVAVVPGPAVLVYPPRYAIVQPPAYYVVPPPVLVQPQPYMVQVGPRIVPRRPVLGFLFPWTRHQWVMVP